MSRLSLIFKAKYRQNACRVGHFLKKCPVERQKTNSYSAFISLSTIFNSTTFTLIKDEGSRLENMIALELYRAVSTWTDLGYGNFSLHFIRNKEKEEVDFLIARDNEPLFLVEVKSKDVAISKPLQKFQSILSVPGIQLVNIPDTAKLVNKILVTSIVNWIA